MSRIVTRERRRAWTPAGSGQVFASLAAAAVMLAAVAGWLQWQRVTAGSAWRADDAQAWLVALAGLCTVALVARRHPSAGWLALIATLSVLAYDLAVAARLTRDGSLPIDRAALDVAVALAAIAASAAAVAYASSRADGRSTVVAALGSGSLVALLAVAAWAVLSQRTPDAVAADAITAGSSLGRLGFVTRGFLAVASVFTMVGLLADARPLARRVRRRVDVGGVDPTRHRGSGPVQPWIGALRDELMAGRGSSADAVRSERRRIARDLHVQVVPAIHRAIREVERDGSAERLSGSLRAILDDVDGLVASRHSIVLDELGLVPALEWLAERAEDRSDIRVLIDVVGDAPADGPPPADVAAAAFVVAELALDNVVRHASRATVQISVAADARSVELVVADDGPGIDPLVPSLAGRDGRRGLVDMAAEARAVGASVSIEPVGSGPGTLVTFHWTAG